MSVMEQPTDTVTKPQSNMLEHPSRQGYKTTIKYAKHP